MSPPAQIAAVDPWLAGAGALTIVSVICLSRAKPHWDHRVNGALWMRPLGLATGLAATALALLGEGSQQWATLPFVVSLLNGFVLFNRRISGYRPATATLTLRQWGAARAPEVRALLEQHLRQIGFQVLDPRGWRWDVASRGNLQGTVTAQQTRVPHMIFARILPGREGLEVTLMAECVDLVLKDTGESANCRQLLLVAAKRFAEPPFREEGAPTPEIALPPMF